MTTMRRQRISEILTNDYHFVQEGCQSRPPLSAAMAGQPALPPKRGKRPPPQNNSQPDANSSAFLDTLSKCRDMTEPWNLDGLAVTARRFAGDREVLDGILLAALKRPLYRVQSPKLVTRRDMAEDVLQEVLFRICTKIVWLRCRDPELLRPWAVRIASRECFRRLRLERPPRRRKY